MKPFYAPICKRVSPPPPKQTKTPRQNTIAGTPSVPHNKEEIPMAGIFLSFFILQFPRKSSIFSKKCPRPNKRKRPGKPTIAGAFFTQLNIGG
jgi:hypothetical protein